MKITLIIMFASTLMAVMMFTMLARALWVEVTLAHDRLKEARPGRRLRRY